MANGIDSIYDPSDVSRMLAELREQRLQMEEEKARKIKGATTVGTKAWEMWSREQTAKTREFLDSEDYLINPKYTDKNWLSRSFTPASKRVMPDPDSAISLDKYKSLTGQDDVATKFGLKEAGAGIGAGMSLYETIRDWDEYKGIEGAGRKGLDIGKTLAYTASAVPGPHQAITAPIGLGLSLIDLLWK